LAYTDDVNRFSRGKQYCAYFGLTPRLDESGSVKRLGHISKQGPSVVRWLVVEAAWRAIKKSPALREFHERVMSGQRGRKKIATVAVARKLLSIMQRCRTAVSCLTRDWFVENVVLEKYLRLRNWVRCFRLAGLEKGSCTKQCEPFGIAFERIGPFSRRQSDVPSLR